MGQNIIELGGRAFVRATNTTVAHDVWLMGKVRAARLDQIDYDPGKAAEVVDQMLDRCFDSGQALTLMAGLLLPADMEPRQWTPSVAQEIEQHLSTLTDVKDKGQITPLLASMLVFFFRSGISSLKISRRSSEQEQEADAEDEGSEAAPSHPQPSAAGA